MPGTPPIKLSLRVEVRVARELSNCRTVTTDGSPEGSGLIVFAHFCKYDQGRLVFMSAKPRIEVFYAGNEVNFSLFSPRMAINVASFCTYLLTIRSLG